MSILKSSVDFSTQFDYAVVSTGYTSRIAKKSPFATIPDFLCDADGCKPVLLKDQLWGDSESSYKEYLSEVVDGADAEVEEGDTIVLKEDVELVNRMLLDCKLDGVVAYKNASVADCIAIVEEMNGLEYCVGCNPSNITSVNTYELDGKSFVVVDVDTSSG